MRESEHMNSIQGLQMYILKLISSLTILRIAASLALVGVIGMTLLFIHFDIPPFVIFVWLLGAFIFAAGIIMEDMNICRIGIFICFFPLFYMAIQLLFILGK